MKSVIDIFKKFYIHLRQYYHSILHFLKPSSTFRQIRQRTCRYYVPKYTKWSNLVQWILSAAICNKSFSKTQFCDISPTDLSLGGGLPYETDGDACHLA